jgi:hypothetical protein
MAFQMSDIPLSNPVVAEAVAGCLHKCDQAFNELLIETKDMMPESDWKLLRHGVADVLATGMFDLWRTLVNQNPRFEKDAFGNPSGSQR